MLISHQSHRDEDDRAFTIWNITGHQGEKDITKRALTFKDFFLEVTQIIATHISLGKTRSNCHDSHQRIRQLYVCRREITKKLVHSSSDYDSSHFW